MKDLLTDIKNDEGFRGANYLDSLNIPTIGFGTRLPLSKEEAELILKSRLDEKIRHLAKEKPVISTLCKARQEVLFNMSYQLGVSGLLKFKRMWEAIENKDFEKASKEGLNSRWAMQTPTRANKLMEIMRG